MPDANLADNSVLTSAFYNTYIREQVVVTCTSSTRPTAVEGRLIYETDTNLIRVYDGSSWVGIETEANQRLDRGALALGTLIEETVTTAAFAVTGDFRFTGSEVT